MENRGDVFPQGEGVLRGGPKRDHISAHLRHGSVGLHRIVVHPGEMKGILENVRRFFEPFLDVAPGVGEPIAEIGSLKLLRSLIMIAHEFPASGPSLMDQGRARCERLVNGSHRGQFPILRLDESHRLVRSCLIHAHNRRHRISHVAHLIDRDNGLVFVGGAKELVPDDIVATQDRDHAGKSGCLLGVDLQQPRVGIRAAQDFSKSHSRNLDITGINGPPGDLFLSVNAEQ